MLMDNNKKRIRRKLTWFDCAELIIALFIPLTIIVYTVMENNTERTIAQENRLHDLKIANERHQQEIMLTDDQQQEATLVDYFNSLGKLLEKNENLTNKSNIVRFKTLTALAQLKSKRKGFLIRSLYENKLITMEDNQQSILDLSLADLTGLDLTNHMLINNEIKCAIFNHTTLINSSFQHMILHGTKFAQAILINSDFSYSSADPWPCYSGYLISLSFRDAILDYSIFNHIKYNDVIFLGSSLIGVKMSNFNCSGCSFLNAKMDLMDINYSHFLSNTNARTMFQSISLFSCPL